MTSTTKELVNGTDGVIVGINKTVDAVKSTMGAQGKTVLILENDQLRITKDGITVAKAINLDDDIQRAGNKLVVNAAQKTVDEVGDGTTATCVLLQAMLSECSIEDRGKINEVLDQMGEAVDTIEKHLDKTSCKVTDVEQIRNIAKISSNSEFIGNLLADVYEQVGFDANVSLELSETSSRTTFEVMKGVEFNSGMVSLKFANRKNGTCVFERPLVLIHEKRLTDFESFIPVLTKIKQDERALLVISPDFSEAFIRSILFNVQQANLGVCLVKSPGFGDGVAKNYADIASLLNEDGCVEKAIITSHTFTLHNTDTPFLQYRLDELEQLSASSIEDYDVQDYKRRFYVLKGSSAIIFAGGTTEQNAREEYDRIEDALGSIKAAIKYGYVEGGGVALLKAKDQLKTGNYGESVIRKICSYPAVQILNNANEFGKEIKNKGYNVKTRKFENFLDTGVIDPTQVVIQSLRNAFATFKLLKNTDFTIYNNIAYGPIGK